MKKKLIILDNPFNDNFFNFLENDFELSFNNFKNFKELKLLNVNLLIFLNKQINNKDYLIFKKDTVLYIVLENNKIETSHLNKNFLKCPTSISKFIDKIYEIFYYKKESFLDIEVLDLKIKNINGLKESDLTLPEKNILTELIDNSSITKQKAEEKILNIKPGVLTNSLDSHLTRIRKKLISIDSKIKIKTKESKIFIE